MMLSKFMINDWPDEALFNQVITDLISKAKAGAKQFRAFGEMVALLWAKGHVGATVRLEHLWNKFCVTPDTCVCSALIRKVDLRRMQASRWRIFASAHSKLIAGVSQSQTEVFYKAVEKQVG